MRRRVVITGMGTINPVGNNAAETWESVRRGACGIAPITQIDTTQHKVKLAGEVKGFDPLKHFARTAAHRMDRFTQLGVVAAREAFAASGLDMAKEDAARCGTLFSSGMGGLGTLEENYRLGERRGFTRLMPAAIPMVITNMAAGMIAMETGFKGACYSISTACASASNAIGEAFRQVRDGYAEIMLCGGTESSITDLGVGGFTSMHALTTETNPDRACIPFDRERSGFVMGEGAGALVLEEREHALARGAVIYGEITGYGATCDAYHMTAPDPDALGASACMEQALRDGNAAPEQVGYINAHGTSTTLNDACETKAIRRVFGAQADRLAVSSTKSMTGHLLGASGALEAILTVLALREKFLPPTIHYRVPDEACDLDVIPNVGRAAETEYALSNSLGFGGHNACLLFRAG